VEREAELTAEAQRTQSGRRECLTFCAISASSPVSAVNYSMNTILIFQTEPLLLLQTICL